MTPNGDSPVQELRDEGLKALAAMLLEAEKNAAKHPKPIASVDVSKDGKAVEIILDTSTRSYGDWIPGEGGDIGLIRDLETNKVHGARLPLYAKTLIIGGTVLPTLKFDLESGVMECLDDEPLPEVARLRTVQSKQAKKIRGLKEAVKQNAKVLRRRSAKLRECMARLKALNGDDDQFRALIAEKDREIAALRSATPSSP